MTENKIDEATRLYLEAFLPDALSNALESYQKFSEQEKEHEKAKDFQDYHNACKVAIAHVELLLKLAKQSEISAGCNKHDQELAKMLSQAEAQVKQHKKADNQYEG